MSSTIDSADLPSATESILAGASSDEQTTCSGNSNDGDAFLHLRIVAIFIIMIGSSVGAFVPILAHRSRLQNVIPKAAFDFAKYFGSGVIIATAFIHLLDPAISELGSECLTGTWQEYPWALALCMFSIFCIFFVELTAFRWGTAKLQKLGISYDAHGHDGGTSHAAHGPEAATSERARDTIPETEADLIADAASAGSVANSDIEKNPTETVQTHVERHEQGSSRAHGHGHNHGHGHGALDESALPQIVGIFTLEFGVLLHSVLIGLTLAVDPDFKVLFVVIVFHQTFEGLGLGSRLAYLKLPKRYDYVIYVAALLYGLTTPIGIAVGLGVRSSYNPASATASAVSGIMDSLSAGVLIYTGLVELLAHEFLFSEEMRVASNRRLSYACACMLVGAGCMSLLGRWA